MSVLLFILFCSDDRNQEEVQSISKQLSVMSQHPSRPPGGHGPPGASSGRASTPSGPNTPTPSNMFKPPSVYSPSSSRRPPTPVHHTRPMSPHSYSGMVHSMSPVPIGMPISPGMSPVFGYPPHGYIQCPRPRWPSSIAQGNQSPRPFIPVQVSIAIPILIPISISCYARLIIVILALVVTLSYHQFFKYSQSYLDIQYRFTSNTLSCTFISTIEKIN